MGYYLLTVPWNMELSSRIFTNKSRLLRFRIELKLDALCPVLPWESILVLKMSMEWMNTCRCERSFTVNLFSVSPPASLLCVYVRDHLLLLYDMLKQKNVSCYQLIAWHLFPKPCWRHVVVVFSEAHLKIKCSMGIPSICVIFHGHGWVTGRMLTGPGGYGFNFEITTDSRVGGCCNLWIWVGAGLKKRTRAGLC